jgi:uncharacterized coiled-coil protein SlyX
VVSESERWVDLEVRLAYQDRTIEQQAEALLEQGRRLEELEKRVSALMRRFEDGPREETGSGPGPE